MISIDHKLLEVDYDNFTYNEAVKVKLACLYISRRIHEYNTMPPKEEQGYRYTYEFANFSNITNGAYGYIHNPYKDVMGNINKMQHLCKLVKESLSEEWLLDYMQFNNKKQTFNTNMMLGRNTDVSDFLKIVKNFDEAVVLYNKACKSKNSIARKYLGFREFKGKKNEKYYRTQPRNYAGSDGQEFHEISVHDDYLSSKSWGFDEYWSIWTSSHTFNKDGSQGFKDVCKIEFAEEFL